MKACKNHCIERLISQAEGGCIVDMIKPKVRLDISHGRTVALIYPWSKKLKRYSTRTNGNFLSLDWKYCPHCGELLTEAGK